MTINEAYKICKENLDNAYTIIPAFIKAKGNEYEIKIQEEDLLQNENNAGINIKIPINENFSNLLFPQLVQGMPFYNETLLHLLISVQLFAAII